MIMLVCGSGYSQTKYSYTDPCTGNIKTVQLSGNTIPFTYYGQMRSFTVDELRSGAFDLWAQSVSQAFGNSNPCGSLVGVPTTVEVSQTVAINFMSVINSLSSLSDMTDDGMTNIVSGATNGIKNSKKEKKGSDDIKDKIESQENSGSKSEGGSVSQGEKSGYSNTVSSEGRTESGTGSSSETTDQRTSDQPGTESRNDEGEGKINLVGNSVNSLQNSSAGSKNGNRPTVLATSDFVGFNFSNNDITYGGKVSGGYTSMRWDGLRASGIMGDYTSAINGPNMAGFYANLTKSRIDIASVSLTTSFQRKFSIYGSVAVGQMWTLKKPKKLKIVYMLVGSYGSVYGKAFTGTAAIAGSMYDLKISKRIDIKMLGLYVYAPYVNYQADILLKSPHVVLPIIGTNIGLTKRFKFNINVGGAWAIGENNLNYTIMMGTRMLL